MELYDLKNFDAKPKKFTGFTHDIDNLMFTPDDKGFYSRDNAGFSIKFCDLSNVKEIIASKEKLNSITLSPDGKLLAGVGNNGTLYIWDVRNNFAQRTLYKNPTALSAVGFSRDGNRLVIGDVNGTVKLISIDNPSSQRVLSGHTSRIEQIVFNHNGKFMATASNDKTVRLWNLEKLREQPIVLSDHADWVRTAVFTVDDEQLLAGINSNTEKAKETIHAWPTKMETMTGLLCGFVKRNLTDDEWAIYVDENLPFERTCSNIE